MPHIEFKITENIPLDELPENLDFISDSQDVNRIKFDLDYPAILADYDSFFVDICDGEYIAVYGMYGKIPFMHKTVDMIEVSFS